MYYQSNHRIITITALVNASNTSISGFPFSPSADVAIPNKVHANIKPGNENCI